MTAMSEDFWARAQTSGANASLKLRETYWGFALAEALGKSGLAETLLKFTGIGIFPTVGALLTFAGPDGLPGAIAIDVGIFIAFSTVGLGLYFYASRGLRRVLQVDTSHGVFRLGTESSKGSFSEKQKYQFVKVESIFLKRQAGKSSTARLHLRLKNKSEPVFILSGPERDLIPVLERITEGVRRAKGSRRARTKTTGRFMHVSFS